MTRTLIIETFADEKIAGVTAPYKSFDSASQGFTLSYCKLDKPELMTDYVSIPGRQKGPLDMSTSLTDGEPVYNRRNLSAIIECSEGTRATRSAILRTLYNDYMGRVCKVTHPDYPNYYLKGRVHLHTTTHDNAHAIVEVTVNCEPWLYYSSPAQASYAANNNTSYRSIYYRNEGAMILRPTITLTGDGETTIKAENDSWTYTLSAGTYLLPELVCPPGGHYIFSHMGTLSVKLSFEFKEAILE